jgi:hypothetical protein
MKKNPTSSQREQVYYNPTEYCHCTHTHPVKGIA